MAMPYASLSPAGDRRSSPAATASLLPFCRSSPFSAGNGVGEEARSDGRWMARPVPFTAAQYEELEHQALIYKYLVAGVPVPPDLVLPIRRGIESLAARFYHNPLAIGYGSYLGKKVDPEPGRCRRTDGKKWRCAKEAASDSKYCERHMHRGRNRSRKPVETQLVPHSQPPPAASAVPPLAGDGFQNHSLYPAIGDGGGGDSMSSTFSALGPPQPHMGNNASPYAALDGGGTCKDFSVKCRYTAYGARSLADEHSQLITEAINTSMENPWRLPPLSQMTAFPLSSYPPQLGATSDLGQNNDNNNNNNAAKAERQQQQLLSFPGCGEFGGGDAAMDSVKQENQTLRPFFDEWPKARDSWSDLTDDNSSLASFSATQLSISIPMTASDFSVASSQSPNGMMFAGEMY